MRKPFPYPSFFVFDVESVGLHGEAFAVAGGVYLPNGACQWEFCFSCPLSEANGFEGDRKWVKENVPVLDVTHQTPLGIMDAFWDQWLRAKAFGAVMAVECGWPVEARFMNRCVDLNRKERNWEGPYPLHEIASYMAAAGMDPMETYTRKESELPAHNPLPDSRLSARLLCEAIEILSA